MQHKSVYRQSLITSGIKKLETGTMSILVLGLRYCIPVFLLNMKDLSILNEFSLGKYTQCGTITLEHPSYEERDIKCQ
jgi:hypothetical protein